MESDPHQKHRDVYFKTWTGPRFEHAPWHMAKCWLDLFRFVPSKQVPEMEKLLIPDLVHEVEKCAKSGNVEFLQQFVDALKDG